MKVFQKLKRIFARKPKLKFGEKIHTVISITILSPEKLEVAAEEVYGPPLWHERSVEMLQAVAHAVAPIVGRAPEQVPSREEWN